MPSQVKSTNRSHPVLHPPAPPGAGKHIDWQGLHGSSVGLAISELAAQQGAPVVFVASDYRRLHQIEAEIQFFRGPQSQSMQHFPDWECLAYDRFSPHQDITSTRLRFLAEADGLESGIVMITAANLVQKLPPVDYVLSHSFSIEVGVNIGIDKLRRHLIRATYQSVSQVIAPGEFAIRGGLVDIYPMGSSRPFRIDFFDDEIDSIRYFDPDTQRSTDKTDSIRMLPAREYPLTESGIRNFRQNYRKTFTGDVQKHPVYAEVSKGQTPAGLEFYFPLFFENTASFFDFIPNNSLIVQDWGIQQALEKNHSEIHDRFETTNIEATRPLLKPERLFLNPADVNQQMHGYRRIRLKTRTETKKYTGSFKTGNPPELPADRKADQPFAAFINFISNFDGRILLLAETAGRREFLLNLLKDYQIRPSIIEGWHDFLNENNVNLAITVSRMEGGLVLSDPTLALITESQVFGQKVYQERRRSRPAIDPESIIRSLTELKPDDPVVHEAHGIGRYKGLQKLGINGEESEFLTLEYRDGDKLYVPILSLSQITRYVGGHPEHAPLHKLGSDAWEKARKRAQKRAYDVAAELLEVQALRDSRCGIAFTFNQQDYEHFADEFAFEETPDQRQVIEEVIEDLRADRPMDRLVCGDVGFGKTEVALRASFVAVHDSRQVAVLVPTTLLAQQHYENFSDRFADYPVKIELLSRFRSKAELGRTVKNLESGQVDIVIGTHRLLQQDIQFKDLGLVILDEEHRFGVRQKERLKRLRSEVDILTLTATPIPRSLNMSMAGLRSISIIGTPPRERLAVKTFVREWSDGLIREACLRELHRGGQVYFLHNEVRTINSLVEHIRQLIPEASVEFAHGQMLEKELEEKMRGFYHQQFNILVCTTIIESGIDIPTANTILINRADRFGLAQLHQLRGRVGRSHHQAYAYLLINHRQHITRDAMKRLDAIESLEELGAGFTLANHDLEIRGAGELLGEAQSGTVDEVGFTLYTDYLNRAIDSITGEKQSKDEYLNSTLSRKQAADINLHIPVIIPETYIPDVHTRLELYKRLSSANSSDALYEIQVEMVDRFGLLPASCKELFQLLELKIRADALHIERIDMGIRGGKVEFSGRSKVDPLSIIELIRENPGHYKLANSMTLAIRKDLPELQDRLAEIDQLINGLKSVNTEV